MRREEQISKLRKHKSGGTCTYIYVSTNTIASSRSTLATIRCLRYC